VKFAFRSSRGWAKCLGAERVRASPHQVIPGGGVSFSGDLKILPRLKDIQKKKKHFLIRRMRDTERPAWVSRDRREEGSGNSWRHRRTENHQTGSVI